MLRTIFLLFVGLSLSFGAWAQAVVLPNTLTPAQKVYGLSKFWQEVNYNFVFWQQVNKVSWDSAYIAAIEQVQKTDNDYEYYRELEKFCALLNDGHTNVYYPQSIDSLVFTTGFGQYRFILDNVESQTVVTQGNAAFLAEIPLGSAVTHVNQIPVKQYQAQFVTPYIASSTNYVREDLAAYWLLRGLRGQNYQVTFRTPKGDIKTLSLTHAKSTDSKLLPEQPERQLLEFKWLDNNVAYVALNSFEDPKIDTLFYERLPELQKAKGLVIDLRNNGGGSTSIGAAILMYLTRDKQFPSAGVRTRENRSSYRAWGKWVTAADTAGNQWARDAYLYSHDLKFHEFGFNVYENTAKNPIVVPTAILVSHNTASAAEDFLVMADKQTHMMRIGQASFGSTGQPLFMNLPGGGQARVCTLDNYFPDGRKFIGVGIQPHIEVSKSLQDFINNRDPELERALKELKKQMK